MPAPGFERTPRVAGIVTWLAVGVPLALVAPRAASGRTAALAAAYLVFGAAFLATSRAGDEPRASLRRVALLAVETASALVVAALLHTGLEGALLVILAAQLVFVLPARTAVAWTAAQLLAYGAFEVAHHPLLDAAIMTTAYVGFSSFALYIGWVARRETRQREELAVLYAELQSTQALLADSTRLAERTRIARDLHDVLGHHLTALSLALEVAAHADPGKAREEVERARSISKLLLSDLRGVVSDFREGEALDVGASLHALAAGIPRPAVTVDVPPDLRVTDPLLAEALVRCAQEIATNAARHSGASRLTISLARREGRLALSAEDDGRGAADVREGNGLTGMRERVRERGGTLRVETAPRAGFRVLVELPDPGGRT